MEDQVVAQYPEPVVRREVGTRRPGFTRIELVVVIITGYSPQSAYPAFLQTRRKGL